MPSSLGDQHNRLFEYFGVNFLISCNLSEILVVTVAGLLNMGNPLLPLQIRFINIITDVFPALALGVGRNNRELMKQPPSDPKTPLIATALFGWPPRSAFWCWC